MSNCKFIAMTSGKCPGIWSFSEFQMQIMMEEDEEDMLVLIFKSQDQYRFILGDNGNISRRVRKLESTFTSTKSLVYILNSGFFLINLTFKLYMKTESQ